MTRPILNSEAFMGEWEKLALREVQVFPGKPFDYGKLVGRCFALGMLAWFAFVLGRFM